MSEILAGNHSVFKKELETFEGEGNSWNSIPEKDHFVQFYQDDTRLIESVTDYIAAGFRQGDPAVVIARKQVLLGIAQQLRSLGFHAHQLQLASLYYPLDAEGTLSEFMIDGRPDAGLFAKTLKPILKEASAVGQVRAFGEMVALLWQEGKQEAAIELEKLWDDLQQRTSFRLFCAYPMASFSSTAERNDFHSICQAHSRVIPAEHFSSKESPNNEDRLRSIAYLQQRAASLETEIKIRKQCEEDLARREVELRDFLETATEGIHQVGPDGKILWANKAELEMFGYETTEYIGHDIREFHADPETITDILCKLKQGEKLREYESRIRHKNGGLIDVSINSTVYREKGKGDFAYTRCFTRDITERKRATELLEKTVEERTAKLQETISELEAFSYSISHDLRAPLRAISAYAESITEDYGSSLDKEAIDRLNRIQKASLRLDTLARDILSYTRVSKAEIELHPIPLSILARGIVEEQRRASICEIVLDELPTAMAHEACFSQCLANLIDNAVKFVAPGITPLVHIKSEMLEGMVRVSVIDNGIGIAAEHRPALFKLFGRIPSETTYSGTGLGLAIVNKAVQRMGGSAGFNSEPGKGSTFWFTLKAVPRI